MKSRTVQKSKTLSGTQVLMEVLKDEGVDTIFGFPGGAVIDIYDELAKTDIRHVLVRHEQGAVHAADGYARAGAKVGVCLVTSGPGATNTVTGIASVYMDSIPMVVLTGQVPTHLIGNDAFQEVDIVGITRPCTKHNYLVQSAEDLPRIIKEAFYLAQSGRPGPVLVDLPKSRIELEPVLMNEDLGLLGVLEPGVEQVGQVVRTPLQDANEGETLVVEGLGDDVVEEVRNPIHRLGDERHV